MFYYKKLNPNKSVTLYPKAFEDLIVLADSGAKTLERIKFKSLKIIC